MKQPLFILGKHRSGTTWLANQLCEHSMIAGIQHKCHQGIHESAYFSHVLNRYGDITQKQNFIEFVEVISKSDYFKLANAYDKEFLYSLYSKSYSDIFKYVMDRYTTSLGADIWIEKTPNHTLFAREIAKEYLDAKFISIIRPYKEYLQSSIGHILQNKKSNLKSKKMLYVVKLTLERIHYNKSIKKLNKVYPNRCMLIDFTDLKKNKKDQLMKVCEFINIPFENNILRESFKPNTSFKKDGIDKINIVKNQHLIVGFIMNFLASCVPLLIYDFISIIKSKLYKKDLPNWFFKLSSFKN